MDSKADAGSEHPDAQGMDGGATPEAPPAADSTVPEPQQPVDDELTQSITTVEGFCVGEATHYKESCGDPGPDDGPACADGYHRPCDGWGEQFDCEEEPGCRWELREVVNEGTATGKRCTGEPCNQQNWKCLHGCVVTKGESRGRVCEGTPSPCATFHYANDCRAQRGCVWK